MASGQSAQVKALRTGNEKTVSTQGSRGSSHSAAQGGGRVGLGCTLRPWLPLARRSGLYLTGDRPTKATRHASLSRTPRLRAGSRLCFRQGARKCGVRMHTGPRTMATSSVSKGCFVFKPDFKKRKVFVPIEDYFNNEELDSEDSKLRFETYSLLWQRMKSETEQLQEELNENLFDNLVDFLQKSHPEFQKNSRDWGSQMKFREIPTAALILGVNVTDHDVILRSLTETLQNNVTPYVVSLQAKDCPERVSCKP